MGGGVHTKSYGALLDGLNKATGVKVDEQVMNINDLYSKLAMGASVGQVPDCALLLTPAIPHFATIGVIDPIDPAVLTQNGIKEADYPKSVWDGETYQGKHYAVTQDLVRDILYLNDKMFQDAGLTDSNGKPKAPTNKEELIATAQKLTKNGAYGFAVGGGASYPAFETFFWQNDANFFSADLSKSALADPAAIEVGDFWGSLATQLKIAPPDGVDQVKGFVAGKVGMVLDGTWDANGFVDAKVAFTVAQVPQVFKKPLVWSIGHEFTFPKQKTPSDAKVAGVWKLIRWMTDNGATWTLEGGVLAVNQKTLQDPRVANDPVLKVFLAGTDNWRGGQSTPKWTDAEAKVEPIMDAIYTGKQSAKDGLALAAKQLDALSG